MKRFDFNQIYYEKKRPLILDGAIGSLIQQKNIPTDTKLWSSIANYTDPQVVIDIHKEYIQNGADIITTNTFRTNPQAFLNSSIDISQAEFVKNSVELAKSAREDKSILIAGSNAPAEDCYQRERTISTRDLMENHIEHINQLWENGSDFILNETQSHFDEIKIITEYCEKNNIPFIVSLFFTNDFKLLSGEELSYVVKFVLDHNPIAVGFNCILPKVFDKITINNDLYEKWGFYLNCGSGDYSDEIISCGITEHNYLEGVKNYIDKKPVFIGACCGSLPSHIKVIKEYFDEIY